MKHILLIWNITLLLSACSEEEPLLNGNYPNVPYDPNVVPLELVWKYPLYADTLPVLSMAPMLYQNGVLVSRQTMTLGLDATMMLLDTNGTGPIWTTDPSFCDECHSLSILSGDGNAIWQNIFIGLCDADPRAVDMNTGSVLWHHTITPGHGPRISILQDEVFHTNNTGINPFTSTSIVRSKIIDNVWDTIITINAVDAYSVQIEPPAFDFNAQGDTLLFFQVRGWKSGPYDEKYDLYAYNMSADSMVWVKYDPDPFGGSAIYPPTIYDHKVYFQAAWTLYCYDEYSGEELWHQNMPIGTEDLLYSNLLIAENKLIVKTSGETLYAFDPVSGMQLWKADDVGASPSDMVYFEGVVYYGSGGDGNIHAVNISSGEQLWELDAGENNGVFWSSVVIDPLLRRLYAHNNIYLYCYKL
ncbi:MAG: PQQ-binding-like beta-propeller repeat protein [Chitinophagales bacterium]